MKPLKLSEAIRLGSISRQQAFGQYERADGSVCGIGAAFVGFGEPPSSMGGKLHHHVLMKLLATAMKMPDCDINGCSHPSSSVGDYIIHQNDLHHLPRNKIADNLEKLGL